MLVNVRIVVERMDTEGMKSEFLFSVPDNLLDKANQSTMRTIAGQLLEGFVWSYKDMMGKQLRLEGGHDGS